MHSSPELSQWDIFCKVIDNFGDIGICWRLVRQLRLQYGFTVRLWVDDLVSFQKLCPEISPALTRQDAFGIEIRRWDLDFPDVTPGDVVIESFACRLPQRFEEAMARRERKPVWVNLDYLSAEQWPCEYHGLPSPHPLYPLIKYFFFPGFLPGTGGLLREVDLDRCKSRFEASSDLKSGLWKRLGFPPPPPQTTVVSLFSYESNALGELLAIWAKGKAPLLCLAPVTRSLPALEAFADRPLKTRSRIERGNLTLQMIPFVEQDVYDELLWLCDMNIVRGEDSFVRAFWAEKPMLWSIYPQAENAHQVKLEAFLDLYCVDMPDKLGITTREFFRAWNGCATAGHEGLSEKLWEDWLTLLPNIRLHASLWSSSLKKQEDLCSSLVRFCRSKV